MRSTSNPRTLLVVAALALAGSVWTTVSATPQVLASGDGGSPAAAAVALDGLPAELGVDGQDTGSRLDLDGRCPTGIASASLLRAPSGTAAPVSGRTALTSRGFLASPTRAPPPLS